MEEFIDFLANPFGQITLFVFISLLLYYLSKNGYFKTNSTENDIKDYEEDV